MRRSNKICIVCKEHYQYCSSCYEDVQQPRWKAIYHNENCKNLFGIATDFLAGDLEKTKAKEMLDKCDLSYKDKLHHEITRAINEINGSVDANTRTATETTTKEKTVKTKTQQTKTGKDNE